MEKDGQKITYNVPSVSVWAFFFFIFISNLTHKLCPFCIVDESVAVLSMVNKVIRIQIRWIFVVFLTIFHFGYVKWLMANTFLNSLNYLQEVVFQIIFSCVCHMKCRSQTLMLSLSLSLCNIKRTNKQLFLFFELL